MDYYYLGKQKHYHINGKKYTENEYWNLFLETVDEHIFTSSIKMTDDELNVFINLSDNIDLFLRDNKSIYRDKFGRKYCSRCEKWLSEERFYNNKSTSDGLMSMCKRCKEEEKDLRKRNFRHINILPNIFSDIGITTHGHHINNIFVVHIPRMAHLKCSNKSSIKHRERLEPIIERIYSISLRGLLTGEWD